MSQVHVPLKHAPWPVQLPGQPPATMSHAEPLKPASHTQPKENLSLEGESIRASHSPWPEQFFSHDETTRSQPSPS